VELGVKDLISVPVELAAYSGGDCCLQDCVRGARAESKVMAVTPYVVLLPSPELLVDGGGALIFGDSGRPRSCISCGEGSDIQG